MQWRNQGWVWGFSGPLPKGLVYVLKHYIVKIVKKNKNDFTIKPVPKLYSI